MADTPADERTLRSDEPSEHHVDVQRAENVFNELSRALSRRSEPEDHKGADIEKGDYQDDDGRFDLRDYLQSSNDAAQSAGIKHKHVGVTWKDLQVEVVGGGNYKVRIITCGLVRTLLSVLPYGRFTLERSEVRMLCTYMNRQLT